MSERVVPYHCPYCGEEDLRPHEPAEGTGHGQWGCRSCLRAFSVKFLGLLPRMPAEPVQAGEPAEVRP